MAVVPNHCFASSLKVLPEKFKIHNILCLKRKFPSRCEGFSNAPRPLKGWETLAYALSGNGNTAHSFSSFRDYC